MEEICYQLNEYHGFVDEEDDNAAYDAIDRILNPYNIDFCWDEDEISFTDRDPWFDGEGAEFELPSLDIANYIDDEDVLNLSQLLIAVIKAIKEHFQWKVSHASSILTLSKKQERQFAMAVSSYVKEIEYE
jgi:hypothetical protein